MTHTDGGDSIQAEAIPEVWCISCGGTCSVDVESRSATCTGINKSDGERCPQKYGFRDEACKHGSFGPYATLFGEINDPETLTQLVEYRCGEDVLWAALRVNLGRITVTEYCEAVSASIAGWDLAAMEYRLEKGWDLAAMEYRLEKGWDTAVKPEAPARRHWWARFRRLAITAASEPEALDAD